MPRQSRSPDERRVELRNRLWPGAAAWVWDPADKSVKGYRPVSRLTPLVLSLIDELAGKTGDPSKVYFELLCREMGQGFVEIDDESACAFAAGYTSERGLRTWRTHMKKLVELGFILARKEGLKEFSKVLILNPLAVCARYNRDGRTTDEWWTAFVSRATDVQAEIPDPAILDGVHGNGPALVTGT